MTAGAAFLPRRLRAMPPMDSPARAEYYCLECPACGGVFYGSRPYHRCPTCDYRHESAAANPAPADQASRPTARAIRLRGINRVIEGRTWESETLLRVGRMDSLEVAIDDCSVG